MKMPAPFALLLFSAPALAEAPADMPVCPRASMFESSATPSGKGDPFAIACFAPQYLPTKRLKGAEVRKTNTIRAQYRKDCVDVAADTIHDVRSEEATHDKSTGLPCRHYGRAAPRP